MKQGINYQWTPGDNHFIMQQMSIIAIKAKRQYFDNKKTRTLTLIKTNLYNELIFQKIDFLISSCSK